MNGKHVENPWRVDADAPLQSFLEWPACPPMVCDTLTGVLSWQMCNETPVRKALASPRIAPEWVAALLALQAAVTVDGDDGPAEVALEAMLRRREGKILALHILPGGPGRSFGAAHVARTPADTPIVAAFATVEMDAPLTALGPLGIVLQARVALTGVWSGPARLAKAPAQLVGGPLDEARIQAVAAAVVDEVAPEGDFLGSEEYRRAMAGVVTRRALALCMSVEGGER